LVLSFIDILTPLAQTEKTAVQIIWESISPSQLSLKEEGGRRPGVDVPTLTAEREPLADIITTNKEVKVTVEMPGIITQDIRVGAYESTVDVSTTEKAKRKYHRIIMVPLETDIETAKSTYLF
jgi:HSP20 family molecular chaperone IbpA